MAQTHDMLGIFPKNYCVSQPRLQLTAEERNNQRGFIPTKTWAPLSSRDSWLFFDERSVSLSRCLLLIAPPSRPSASAARSPAERAALVNESEHAVTWSPCTSGWTPTRERRFTPLFWHSRRFHQDEGKVQTQTVTGGCKRMQTDPDGGCRVFWSLCLWASMYRAVIINWSPVGWIQSVELSNLPLDWGPK